jgi:hypothetical protein
MTRKIYRVLKNTASPIFGSKHYTLGTSLGLKTAGWSFPDTKIAQLGNSQKPPFRFVNMTADNTERI